MLAIFWPRSLKLRQSYFQFHYRLWGSSRREKQARSSSRSWKSVTQGQSSRQIPRQASQQGCQESRFYAMTCIWSFPSLDLSFGGWWIMMYLNRLSAGAPSEAVHNPALIFVVSSCFYRAWWRSIGAWESTHLLWNPFPRVRRFGRWFRWGDSVVHMYKIPWNIIYWMCGYPIQYLEAVKVRFFLDYRCILAFL